MKNETRVAFISAVNDDFVEPYLTMMYSLYKHNPYFKDMDVIVIDAGLSHEKINIIKNNIKNVSFIKPNIDISQKDIKTPARLMESFSKLKAFDIKSHDFLVVIDCDMVILKKWNIDFSKLSIHTISACKAHLLKQGEMNFFNGGFLIIPKEINTSSQDLIKLINKQNSGLAEQDILNIKFKDFNVLPKKYNVEKKLFNRLKNDCTILHYVGSEKPWNSNNKTMLTQYNIWRKYNNEMKKHMTIK